MRGSAPNRRARRHMPSRRPYARQSKGAAVIAGLQWLCGCFVPCFGRLFHVIFKAAMRFFTGRGEIERILIAGHHSRVMTAKLSKYLRKSRRLVDVRNLIFRPRARFNVEQLTTMIISRKGIKPSSREFRTRLMPNLIACLRELNGTNAVLEAAERERITEFGPQHEGLLRELWSLLIDTPLPGRITAEWGRLGFQGTDPVSDLRGNGVLGLHNLVYFARTFNKVCREIVGQYDSAAGLPLAITSINMTSFVMDTVQSRLLDTYFESLGEMEDPTFALQTFNQVFGLIFVLFPPFFRASRPRDLMDFPRIYGQFQDALTSVIVKTGRIPETLHVQ